MKNLRIEVIAPTRGRPEQASRMARSWKNTRYSSDTGLTLVLDSNDPTVQTYFDLSEHQPWVAAWFDSGSMVHRANIAVGSIDADIYGFAADDNLFRTVQWDRRVRAVFEDPNVTTVNTNDLLVGNNKGGAFFISRKAVDALGWFLPPFLEHLYVDWAVTEMAKGAGTYRYLPDVVIEHLHPYAGKAAWDAQYRSYNNPTQDRLDGDAFGKWWSDGQAKFDMETLRRCSTS